MWFFRITINMRPTVCDFLVFVHRGLVGLHRVGERAQLVSVLLFGLEVCVRDAGRLHFEAHDAVQIVGVAIW